MWLIALLLLMSPQAVPTSTEPPSLIVQLVDPTWDPLPGADVTVNPFSRSELSVTHTDKDGYAKFWIAGDNDYEIEAKLTGFKTKRLKHVHLFKSTTASPTAYIQFKLKLSGPTTTVY